MFIFTGQSLSSKVISGPAFIFEVRYVSKLAEDIFVAILNTNDKSLSFFVEKQLCFNYHIANIDKNLI